ncbi:uncharacterized protein [Amphiura filiformis]|uniref:uncharacterized protein n=1 Tax=Amphiura filiformis TaxID=82378 RepID=UPI003B21C0AD
MSTPRTSLSSSYATAIDDEIPAAIKTDMFETFSPISLSATDACENDHTLVVSTNNPNKLKAFTGPNHCSVLSLLALKVLDLSNNAIDKVPSDLFLATTNLSSLDVSKNSLEIIPFNAFKNLRELIYLNSSKNSLSSLPSFKTQAELKVLDLSENRLQNLTFESFIGLDNLQSLFLSNNQVLELPNQVFHHLQMLVSLNISNNGIQEIDFEAFHFKLATVDLRGSNLYKITRKSFEILNISTAVVLVDKYSSCCFIADAKCISQEPRPEYLTCNRMLPYVPTTVFMWFIGLFALICNGIACYFRSQKRQANKVQTLFILNLSLSDLLMGINMLILVIADAYYEEFFPSYAHLWRQGFACKCAGFLSILSSEGSVFFITLISIDRFLGIKYTFGSRRLTTRMARICVAFAWLTALLLGVISIGLSNEESQVFSISEVCIGIPIVRQHLTVWRNDHIQLNGTEFITNAKYGNSPFIRGYNRYMYQQLIPTVPIISINEKPSHQNVTFTTAEIIGSQISPIFSIVVFVGVNLLCFIIVATCYIQIFMTARNTSKRAARTQTEDEERRMARKMCALVFTDFFCWVPLCITCILAQCQAIEISPTMYVWIVGFILPINSSINPFLYVIYEAICDYREKRQEARNARQQIELQQR